jgi:hypothetical protein
MSSISLHMSRTDAYAVVCKNLLLAEHPYILVRQVMVPINWRWQPDEKNVFLLIEEGMQVVMSLQELKEEEYFKDVLDELGENIHNETCEFSQAYSNAEKMQEFLLRE